MLVPWHSVPSQGRRHLELCRSVDCALASRFLEPMHVYIHFQAYWACLVVIETNEKSVAAWHFVQCLAIVERWKTTDARGSPSSPSRPRKAPKCVWREYVRSVSLCFHGFWAWQNRNCQSVSESCLDRRDFFFLKSKASHVFQRSRSIGTGFHLIVGKKMDLFAM